MIREFLDEKERDPLMKLTKFGLRLCMALPLATCHSMTLELQGSKKKFMAWAPRH